MGELIHFSHDPRDRKPTEDNKITEIPTDMMADARAERRRKHIRALDQVIEVPEEFLPVKVESNSEHAPAPIEVPDTFIIPGSREATLGAEAAKAADISTDNGRFGLGKVKVDMPADPSRVPGWNGDTRR